MIKSHLTREANPFAVKFARRNPEHIDEKKQQQPNQLHDAFHTTTHNTTQHLIYATSTCRFLNSRMLVALLLQLGDLLDEPLLLPLHVGEVVDDLLLGRLGAAAAARGRTATGPVCSGGKKKEVRVSWMSE